MTSAATQCEFLSPAAKHRVALRSLLCPTAPSLGHSDTASPPLTSGLLSASNLMVQTLSLLQRVVPVSWSWDEPSAAPGTPRLGLEGRRGSAPGRWAVGCALGAPQHCSDASFLSAGWLRCSDHLLLAGTGKQQLKIEGDFWFTQMTRDNFGSPKAKETKLSGFNGSLSPSCSMFMGKQAADQTRQTAAGEAQ